MSSIGGGGGGSSSSGGYVALTNMYITNLGSTPTDAYRIDQFFRALMAAGLDDDLVDGCFLTTTQNLTSGIALKTIRGADAVLIDSPVIGTEETYFDGISQYIYWPVTNTTASSVAMTSKGVGYTDYAGVNNSTQSTSAVFWSLQNSLGIGNQATMGGMSFKFEPSTLFGAVNTNQTAASTFTDPIYDPSTSAFDVIINNPWEQTTVITNDNAASPTIKAYLNHRLLLTDSSGNTKTTVARNRFYCGAREFEAGAGGVVGFFRGSIKNWFLFNKVLSDAEATALTSAIRWLDRRTKNVVYVGDSTSAHLWTKPYDNWPVMHCKMPKQLNAKCWNAAVNGQTVVYFNTNYDAHIKPYRCGANGVEAAEIYIWLGINDILGGAAAATVYSNLKSLWSKARGDGFKVTVMTLMTGSYYISNPSYNTVRTTLNTSIMSDPDLYDSLFRPDIFFTDPYDTSIFFDTIHLQWEGNRQLAGYIDDGHRQPGVVPLTYYLTDAATIATDCSLFPDNCVLKVTLGGNRTLGNPTNPTNGKKIIYRITQDGTRTITLDTKFRAGPFTVTLSVGATKTDYLEVVYDIVADKWDVVNFQKGY